MSRRGPVANRGRRRLATASAGGAPSRGAAGAPSSGEPGRSGVPAIRRLRLVLEREGRRLLGRPGTWLLVAGYLLAVGLFYLLRLSAGEGGDHAGFLREIGAVLLPVACLLGASALDAPVRLLGYRAAALAPFEVTLGLLAPLWALAAVLGLVGGSLPLLTLAEAPVDPGYLLAGGLALALLGAGVASLGAACAALLGHAGAGALVAFLLALTLWGAPGLAAATGLGTLRGLDLGAGLVAAGQGWFSLVASSPALGLLALATWVTRESLEVRRA